MCGRVSSLLCARALENRNSIDETSVKSLKARLAILGSPTLVGSATEIVDDPSCVFCTASEGATGPAALPIYFDGRCAQSIGYFRS